MSRFVPVLVPVVAGALLALAPGGASACGCYAPLDYDFVYPPPGSNAVPPDARIWVNAEGRCEGRSPCLQGAAPALRLFQSDVEVESRLGLLESATSAVIVLTPASRLAVSAQYELRGPEEQVLTTFGVAELVPHARPSPPPLVQSDPVVAVSEEPSSCAPAYGFALYFEPTGLLTVLDVAGEAALDDDAPAGTVSGITDRSYYALGTGACQFDWPGAAPGATTMVRFGSFHPDGTFSGWSPWTFLRVPADGAGGSDEPAGSGCGCSTTSPAPVEGFLALALACAARLRRRAR